MAKLLIIHHDKATRTVLEILARPNHQLEIAKDVETGVRLLSRSRPEVIVVGQDSKKEEGVRLLRYLKGNGIELPVVVIVSRGGGLFQPIVMKLGARGFLEYPVDQARFDQAIASALEVEAARVDLAANPPPITDEELNTNLSVLETALNRRMKCVAGRNQVFIQSIVLGRNSPKTKPRIALKCPLREEYGMVRDVYYEYIRDVCCSDPGQCPAVQQFRATKETA